MPCLRCGGLPSHGSTKYCHRCGGKYAEKGYTLLECIVNGRICANFEPEKRHNRKVEPNYIAAIYKRDLSSLGYSEQDFIDYIEFKIKGKLAE